MAIALIHAILVLVVGQPVSQRSQARVDVLCGPYCVYVASLALGMQPGNVEEFVETFSPALKDGYSLLQLDEGARRIGLKTLAIHADLGMLARIRRPFACIAVLDNHFALIQDVDSADDTVLLVDPPHEKRLPIDTFKQMYSGDMLILSPSEVTVADGGYWRYFGAASMLLLVTVSAFAGIRALRKRGPNKGRVVTAAMLIGCTLAGGLAGCDSYPSHPVTSSGPAADSGSALRLEPPVLDFGKTFVDSPNQTIEGAVRLKNDGNVPIRIASLEKDCACTNTELDLQLIPPGTFAKLTTRIKVGDRSGPNRSTVTVVCTNESIPNQTVVVLWEAVTKLFTSPDSQALGRLDTRESRTVRQVLQARRISFCPDCRLTAESRHGLLSAAATLNPLAAGTSHDFDESALADSGVREVGNLEVTVKPGGEAGDYSAGIDIGLHCGTAVRSSLFVPVTWSIRPSIELHPSRLWLGVCRAGQDIEREVTVTSAENTPFQISSVSCDVSTLLKFAEFATDKSTSHRVRIGLRANADPGTHRVTLTLKLAGHRLSEALLPVSFLIK
jgi:Protein of unknown function (DUF1573)/Peptidase C39 family